MSLPKRYTPAGAEPALDAFWQELGVYHFDSDAPGPVYAIDTPPPTVSGQLHLGHVYSYSQTDFMARFWRMNGYNVFYPMGYDDNGLPTERLVEKRLGKRAAEVGRAAFIAACTRVSEEIEAEYEAVWRRLGLSIDWRYSYRTIDELARRTSQLSFLDLYRKDLAYRRKAPTIWCPECGTAIAQAELADLERESEFVTLAFTLPDGATLPIATTRPELLPACVAVFVHPNDARFQTVVGQSVYVPLFGQEVPLLADAGADPAKGTGAVMCCTFGDSADVEWWYGHNLALRETIDREGRLTEIADEYAGLPVSEARRRIVAALEARGTVLERRTVAQSVRVHERCDTPVEYIVTRQWFIRVLEFKQAFLDAGERITWRPAYMKARYREWVENMGWDWCISRQRYFGLPFPVWFCAACDEVMLAAEEQLPVDPAVQSPPRSCGCGSTSFVPEEDVMDTWATSSLSPQIVGRWRSDPALYHRVFPMTLRAQAHEIIRTWAFYTIVKSHHHFGALPWQEIALSGWGLAPTGAAKMSKSRDAGPTTPPQMMERYSADAVRYWAASQGLGKDTIISEEKIAAGARLVTKLWNVAGFSARFLEGYQPPLAPPALSPSDLWILARSRRLVRQATEAFRAYDYAAAKNETEAFLWNDLADNYLEMAKTRLYDEATATHEGARYALYHALLAVVKLFAPVLPYVTEEIYRGLFAAQEGNVSVHRAAWPVAAENPHDEMAEAMGEALVQVATAVRRYKSEHVLSLSAPLERLQVTVAEAALAEALREAVADISSVTRARRVEVVAALDPTLEAALVDATITVALALPADD